MRSLSSAILTLSLFPEGKDLRVKRLSDSCYLSNDNPDTAYGGFAYTRSLGVDLICKNDRAVDLCDGQRRLNSSRRFFTYDVMQGARGARG